MTRVVNVKVAYIRPEFKNLKDWCEHSNNIYIGRRGIVFIDGKRYPITDSKWANPFRIAGATREKVIADYRNYITKKISENPEYYDVSELRNKTLGCWCAPESCHGDVLISLVQDSPCINDSLSGSS
jgi:hypothetical protein